jgi:Ankyrin repeat
LNYTPLMLCVISESSDKESLDVVKLLLNKEGVERNCVDHDMNNIMHLAVRTRKLLVVKYLVEEIKFPVDELNSDGKSAIAIAKEYGFTELEQFLSKFNNSESQIQILEELMSYINESDKKGNKKGKNKKKKKNDDDEIVLRISEYSDNTLDQGTSKPIVEIEKSNNIKVEESSITGNKEVIEQPKVHKITTEEIEYFKTQERLMKEKREIELQKQEQLKQEKLKTEKELKKQKKKQQTINSNIQKVDNNQNSSENIQKKEEIVIQEPEKVSLEHNIIIQTKVEEKLNIPKHEYAVLPNLKSEIKINAINNEGNQEIVELRNRLELFENLYREESIKRQQAERVLESRILEYNSIIGNKPTSTEENINDLISLANEELMKKTLQINEVNL